MRIMIARAGHRRRGPQLSSTVRPRPHLQSMLRRVLIAAAWSFGALCASLLAFSVLSAPLWLAVGLQSPETAERVFRYLTPALFAVPLAAALLVLIPGLMGRLPGTAWFVRVAIILAWSCGALLVTSFAFSFVVGFFLGAFGSQAQSTDRAFQYVVPALFLVPLAAALLVLILGLMGRLPGTRASRTPHSQGGA